MTSPADRGPGAPGAETPRPDPSHPGRPSGGRTGSPGRLLKRFGIASIVLGLVVSGLLMIRVVSAVPPAPTSTMNSPIRLDEPGLTLFAGVPNAPRTCAIKDQAGAEVPLGPPPRSERYELGDTTYYVLAHSTAELPPQTFTVTCADRSIPYFLGQRHTLDTFAGPVILSLGAFTFFSLLGAALLIAAQRQRKRSNR